MRKLSGGIVPTYLSIDIWIHISRRVSDTYGISGLAPHGIYVVLECERVCVGALVRGRVGAWARHGCLLGCVA
eukprot:302110-Pleurochrysis_carterae.AAC.2